MSHVPITAKIDWQRGEAKFVDQKYSRAHTWNFDGGAEVPASSSPQVVPLPMSDASAVDPEEAFVASISSCHLLWFLALAAKEGYVVDRYEDHAVGEMGKNDAGQIVILRVVLRPNIIWETEPEGSVVDHLHHVAHEKCFIANSVRSEVVVESPVEH